MLIIAFKGDKVLILTDLDNLMAFFDFDHP